MKKSDEHTVTFYRCDQNAIDPMPADAGALGMLATDAYRYCEPLRVASSYGWYMFPPAELRLKFNGVDILYKHDDEWIQVTDDYLNNDMPDFWDQHAPEELKNWAPPHLRKSGAATVQIWSGFLVKTAPEWSLNVRSIVNFPPSQFFSCFEGIIDTDSFSPTPLFTNIKLYATHQEIIIPHHEPLFQIQPIQRASYSKNAMANPLIKSIDDRDSAHRITREEWTEYTSTVRHIDIHDREREVGLYARNARKRVAQENKDVT